MSRITLTIERDDGAVFSVDGETWGLLAAEGLDKPSLTVYTQKAALTDGDLVTATRVGSREVELTLKTPRPALNEVLRRQATSFFTLAHTYALHVTRYGKPRYARNCRLESMEIPTERQYVPITLKLTLLCPEGYFVSEDNFGKNLAAIESRCGYPYAALSAYGRILGVYSYAGTVYLDNDGDAEAYCKAVFLAKGTVTNPKLIAGDGYVRVLCTLHAGDTLIIDGETRQAMINGAAAARLIDKNSNFDGITFAVGTNHIGFAADVGSNLLDVYVYYNKRYLGA